jgi:hypothetical protein
LQPDFNPSHGELIACLLNFNSPLKQATTAGSRGFMMDPWLKFQLLALIIKDIILPYIRL